MGQQQSPELVVGVDPVAVPAQEHDPRRANRLAGMEPKMGERHAGHQTRGPGRVALDNSRPLARPANRHKQALAAEVQVEKREGAVRGTPADRGQGKRLAVFYRTLIGHEAVLRTIVAVDLVEDQRLARRCDQLIGDLDVF